MTTAGNEIEVRRQPRTFAWAAVAGVAVATGLGVFFWFDPARNAFYPACLLHRLTGLNCPGCGAQRALHELLHGNFPAAARDNALFVFSLPLLVWMAVRLFIRKARGEPAAWTLRPAWIWLFVAVAGVFGVLRNLPAFAWLSP